MKTKREKQVLEIIKSGQADIIIGTHALFQKGFYLKNLNWLLSMNNINLG